MNNYKFPSDNIEQAPQVQPTPQQQTQAKSPYKSVSEVSVDMKELADNLNEISKTYKEQIADLTKTYKDTNKLVKGVYDKKTFKDDLKTLYQNYNDQLKSTVHSFSDLEQYKDSKLGDLLDKKLGKDGDISSKGPMSIVADKIVGGIKSIFSPIQNTLKGIGSHVLGDGLAGKLITNMVSSPIFWVISGILAAIMGLVNYFTGKGKKMEAFRTKSVSEAQQAIKEGRGTDADIKLVEKSNKQTELEAVASGPNAPRFSKTNAAGAKWETQIAAMKRSRELEKIKNSPYPYEQNINVPTVNNSQVSQPTSNYVSVGSGNNKAHNKAKTVSF